MNKKVISLETSKWNANLLPEDRGQLINAFENTFGPEFLEHLVKVCEVGTLKKGERIIKQGDLGDYAYIIAMGEVEINVNDIYTKTPKVLCCVKGGTETSIVGERSLLLDEPRSASVSISSDTARIIRIQKSRFLEIESHTQNGDLRLWLHELAEKRMRELYDKIIVTPERDTIFDKIIRLTPDSSRSWIQEFIAREKNHIFKDYQQHQTHIFLYYAQRFAQFTTDLDHLLGQCEDNERQMLLGSLQELERSTSSTPPMTSRDATREESIVSMLVRGWRTEHLASCRSELTEVLMSLGIETSQFEIVIAPKSIVSRGLSEKKIMIPCDINPDEFKRNLPYWVILELANKYIGQALDMYHGKPEVLFGNSRSSGIMTFSIDPNNKPDPKACLALSWMKMGLFMLEQTFSSEMNSIEKDEKIRGLLSFFEKELGLKNGTKTLDTCDTLPMESGGKSAALRNIMADFIHQELKYILSPASRYVEVVDQDNHGSLPQFYKSLGFALPKFYSMGTHPSITESMDIYGIIASYIRLPNRIYNERDHIPPKAFEVCEKENMLFILETFLDVVKKLDKEVADAFIHEVVSAILFARETLHIRWAPTEILNTALEFTIDWAEATRQDHLEIKDCLFLMNKTNRDKLVQYAGAVKQTTYRGRVKRQQVVLNNFLAEIAARKPDNTPLRSMDVGIAANVPIRNHAAITTREWALRLKNSLPNAQLYGIDRGGIAKADSAISWGINEKKVHIIPFDQPNLSYVEADALTGLPFPDQYIDAALVANVILHLRDDAQEQLLKNVLRKIRAGGILLFGFDENGYVAITRDNEGNIYYLGTLEELEDLSQARQISAKVNDVLKNKNPLLWTELLLPFH